MALDTGYLSNLCLCSWVLQQLWYLVHLPSERSTIICNRNRLVSWQVHVMCCFVFCFQFERTDTCKVGFIEIKLWDYINIIFRPWVCKRYMTILLRKLCECYFQPGYPPSILFPWLIQARCSPPICISLTSHLLQTPYVLLAAWVLSVIKMAKGCI